MKKKKKYHKPVNESFFRHSLWTIQRIIKSLSYLRLPDHNKRKKTVFFIVDPHYFQGGFADRIKSIVNTYFIARQNGLNFKLYFHDPFNIENYYTPNIVDWRCELEDLDKSIFSSRLSFYRADYPLPVLKKRFQYHYYWYVGVDLIRYTYPIIHQKADENGWMEQFKTCFDELFTPSEHLLNLAKDTGLQERKYISAHFRFINLLGNFEGRPDIYPTLGEEEQIRYMEKCLDSLKKISSMHPEIPVYVFSDSEKFLKKCEEAGYHRIAGGEIGHIAYSESKSVADKTLLDFYIISKSEAVYSVIHPGMAIGQFAEYAAIIGGVKHKFIFE